MAPIPVGRPCGPRSQWDVRVAPDPSGTSVWPPIPVGRPCGPRSQWDVRVASDPSGTSVWPPIPVGRPCGPRSQWDVRVAFLEQLCLFAVGLRSSEMYFHFHRGSWRHIMTLFITLKPFSDMKSRKKSQKTASGRFPEFCRGFSTVVVLFCFAVFLLSHHDGGSSGVLRCCTFSSLGSFKPFG